MANVLKDGKTYTDVRGVIYTNPYMVLNNTIGVSSPIQTFQFSVEIYASQDAKNSGYQPVLIFNIQISADDINTYLVTPQTTTTSTSPLGLARKAVYTYLGTVEPPIPGVVWSDWKSDDPSGVPQTMFHS